MSAEECDLRESVRKTLETTGVLEEVRAKVRVEVVRALKGKQTAKDQLGNIARDDFVINELIKEYLDFKGYSNSKEVFCLESRQPSPCLSRESLEDSLGVECGRNAAKVPLLYSIVKNFAK